MADGRYNNGKIYKLVNDVDDEIYIGSTCLPLSKRFYGHKIAAKKRNVRVYQHLNNIGWDNVKIILIEEYPCNNKMELLRKEREHIENLNPQLNMRTPTRTNKEYYEANKEVISQKRKEWRENNKELISIRVKEWRENNKSYMKEYREANKEVIAQKKKDYAEKNKEKIAEVKKYYYEANKEVINKKKREYGSQRVNCPICNKEIRSDNISRHIKTQHE
jgi:hypothetical protein